MKIVNLGTSHGDATPSRYHSSTLIETSGRYYLVDAGEPVSATLIRRGINPSAVTAVFVTHMHADHAGGLPVLVEQAHKYRRKFPEIHPEFLVPDEAAVPAFYAWASVNQFGKYVETSTVRSYDPGLAYEDPVLKMTAFPNGHLKWCAKGSSARSNSLKIESEGKKVFFTGDLSCEFTDFPSDAADHCDLVYSELTHFPLEKALPVLKTLSIGKLIFYHLHNPIQTSEGAEKVLRICREQLSYPVAIAFDGMETVL